MRYSFRGSRQLEMICHCKRRTSPATLLVVSLLQLCQATLVTGDPEYVYLLPNASISKCGPDKLRLDLVKEDTLSDLYSYIPIVALRAFCKLENGLCRQSNVTLESTEKKERIKLRMGRQTNCSGMPVYDNNVCTLKMEAQVYGGDPEFYNHTFTCKAFQGTISPMNTTQHDFVAQTSANTEMSVAHLPDTTTLSDVSLTVGSAVPAILLFLLLFIAILLLSMILLSIRRDKRKKKIPPNNINDKILFLLTLDTSTMNSETISEDKITIYDTIDTDYSRLKSPDRMADNTSIQCLSSDCQSKYLSDPEDSCNYVHLKNNVRSNSLS